MLEIDGMQLGQIGTNCYIARNQGSTDAVVFDPGAEPERVLALLEERGLQLAAIVVTHCHWDHTGGVAGVAAATSAPVWMSGMEAPALETPEQFAFPGAVDVPACAVDHRLDGGERIDIAGIAFDVLHVPGHSPGHLAFVTEGIRDASGDGFEVPPVCFIGDVIFRGSVGRSDLPFSDPAELERTLDMLKVRLAPETVLLSGHGGVTTMADELRSNPFLRA